MGSFAIQILVCQAYSFAVMERMRIREAMAFDPHFTQYGKFVVARAQD